MSTNDHAELDRQLQRSLGPDTPQLTPSPALTHAVMARVHAEAEASAGPRPLAFPWRRALPGLAAGCVVLALCMAAVLRGAAEHLPATHVSALLSLPSYVTAAYSSIGDASRLRLGWLAIALLIALVPLSLTGRLIEAKQRAIER